MASLSQISKLPTARLDRLPSLVVARTSENASHAVFSLRRDMADEDPQDSSKSLPPWVRITIGIVGAIGTLGTIFTGVYQINSQRDQAVADRQKEEHQFQLQQQATKGNVDKELLQMQLTLQGEQTREKEAQEVTKRQDLEKAKAEQAAASLQVQLKTLELNSAKEKDKIERDHQSAARIETLIADLLTKTSPVTEGALAELASETQPDGQYHRVVMAALSAKAANLQTQSEAQLLIDRMTDLGFDSAAAMAGLHRKVAEGLDLAISQYLEAFGPTNDYIIQDRICNDLLKRAGLSGYDAQYVGQNCRDVMLRNFRPEPQNGAVGPQPVTRADSTNPAAPDPAAPRGQPVLSPTIRLGLFVLRRSAQVLPEILRGARSPVPIDLSGIYLRGTIWSGTLPSIVFERADVWDTDFASAQLDDATIASLAKANPISTLIYRNKSETFSMALDSYRIRLSGPQIEKLARIVDANK
jgi:hypothetical protein